MIKRLLLRSEFFKFQDAGDISSVDFADAFDAMYRKGRYHEMLVLVDTCQGGTLHQRLYSPNVLMCGSSSRDENSWSHGINHYLGTTMMDEFTHSTMEFFARRVKPGLLPIPSLHDLVNRFAPSWVCSFSLPPAIQLRSSQAELTSLLEQPPQTAA